MKAWRKKGAQERFRTELNSTRKVSMGDRFEPYTGPIGRVLRDSTGTTKVTFPSALLQALMIRGGYWPMPKGVQP